MYLSDFPFLPFNLIVAIETWDGPISVSDLAQLVRKSPDTIYRAARAGKYPLLRINGSISFDPSTLGRCLRKKYPHMTEAANHILARIREAELANGRTKHDKSNEPPSDENPPESLMAVGAPKRPNGPKPPKLNKRSSSN